MSNMSDKSTTSDTTDTTGSDLIYDTAAVSKALMLGESTIRKYCALMVKHNYKFHKAPAGHRIFYDTDIDVLRQIVSLKNTGEKTLEESVIAVLSGDIDDADDVENASVVLSTSDTVSYNTLLEEFSAFKEDQQRFNEKLLQQFQKQQDYIDNRLEIRDQLLLDVIRETQETTKKEIAAAEEKKGFFSKWFKK